MRSCARSLAFRRDFATDAKLPGNPASLGKVLLIVQRRFFRLGAAKGGRSAYVRDELGLARFEIDMTDHDLDAVERKRPGSAERQRRLHEAGGKSAVKRAELQRRISAQGR
jgi:hypothetical protein